ncbi:MAG: hypothetical protein M3441_01085 [Chloroflexota bacterium]|nr:hypothetical protein [Chloroflexota bacterium]
MTMHYWVNQQKGWKPLPSWVEFFTQLGEGVACQPLDEARVVVSLALPTRAFAAAFAALGVVRARCIERSTTPNPREHFSRLLALPKDTPLRVLLNGELVQAIHGGSQVVGGKTMLKVMYEDQRFYRKEWKGRLLDADMAVGVAVANDRGDKILKHKTTREMRGSDFLACFLGQQHDPTQYTLDSCCECAILGQATTLQDEVCNTRLSLLAPTGNGKEERVQQGSLQDILRVRRFLASGEPSKTDVVPIGPACNAVPSDGDRPCVVVFDGASAYIRWRDYWRFAHWIVLLDRTDRQYWAGLDVVNAEWRQNRLDNIAPAALGLRGVIPDCIEAVMYEDVLP